MCYNSIETDAKEMLQKLLTAIRAVGVEIDYKTTKMLTNFDPSDLIQIEDMKLVEKYYYLGHEIKIRIDNHTAV